MVLAAPLPPSPPPLVLDVLLLPEVLGLPPSVVLPELLEASVDDSD
jgi:hypothetical protein